MTNSDTGKQLSGTHWSLWVVGLLAIIWHGLGCMNFFMQLNPEMLAQMPESHRSIAESRPVWATAAFAISVFCGVIGGVLLLLKKRAAISMFLLSLIGAIVATVQGVTMGGALSLFGPAEIAMAVLGPLVLGIFLVWFAKAASSKGWIQ